MTSKRFRSAFSTLTLLSLLTACSGGNVDISVDPEFPPLPLPATSEAITANGVITGLGGVTINDIRYTTNSVTVDYNGQPGTLADLEHGQIITLAGRIDGFGLSGTANSITYDASLIGPVANLDAPNQQLIVMGQTINSDSATRFGTGIDPETFAGLAAGDVVQISGYRDAAGTIRATRIDADTASTELQLIGKVSGVDTANLMFTIDRLSIDYRNAIFIDLPGGAPSNGMMVKVIGNMSGSRFEVERLVAAPVLNGSTGRRVQTAGFITRFNSRSDFDVNGATISTDSGTAFRNGNSGNLALNAKVTIDGDFASSGRIAANRITFGHLASNIATLAYDYSDFDEIMVPTVFNVTVTQGSNFNVQVQVDEEGTNNIDVTQSGSRLNIALAPGDYTLQTLHAYITMPVLDRIDLTGVANATLNDFDQAEMTVNVGNVSRLQGNGLRIDNLTANVSGVSYLSFGDIRPIGNAHINVSGVSQATLNMDVGSTMTGTVGTGQGTGISALRYYGTNVDVDVTTDFLSSVTWLGDTRP